MTLSTGSRTAIAQLVYRMLRYGQDDVDIGEAKYEQKSLARRLANLKNNATELGFTLVPAQLAR